MQSCRRNDAVTIPAGQAAENAPELAAQNGTRESQPEPAKILRRRRRRRIATKRPGQKARNRRPKPSQNRRGPRPKPSNRRPVKSPHIRPKGTPRRPEEQPPMKRPRENKRAPKRHIRGRPELGPKPANAQRWTDGQKRPLKASNSLIDAFLYHSGTNTHK